MSLFGSRPIKVLGFDQASMKRFGSPFRFSLARTSSSRMYLSGCIAYPYSANRKFKYGMVDPHACLDKKNVLHITPVQADIHTNRTGSISVSLGEFNYLELPFAGVFKTEGPITTYVINGPGVYVLGWPSLKKVKVVSGWNSNGTPAEYERMFAYPYAAMLGLKRGRTRDIIEFSLFTRAEVPARGRPHYAPVWISGGTGSGGAKVC